MARRLLLFGAMAIISGCGDDPPAAPSPPAPTINTLTISGADAVRTGFVANYTATAQLSNGTTQTVTPVWSSSSPLVGSVDGAGRLDGLAHGSINLSASYQGLSASKQVNVVHNYGGNWTGTYEIRACDQSGAFASIGWCEAGGVGEVLPFSLALAQDGNGRFDRITGTLSFGDLAGNISGNVTGDGRLVIGGAYSVSVEDGLTFTIQVGGWDTRPAAGDSMSGGWALNFTAVGAVGNAYEEHRIFAVTHTSQQTNISAAPDRYVLSRAALFERMRR